MCYGNPDVLLAQFLAANPLVKNHLGHTALDDFDHFCASSGLSVETAGASAFSWGKYGYVSAWYAARATLSPQTELGHG